MVNAVPKAGQTRRVRGEIGAEAVAQSSGDGSNGQGHRVRGGIGADALARSGRSRGNGQGHRVRGVIGAEALARSGRGSSDHVVDGLDRFHDLVGLLLLSALVRQPGGGQELSDPVHGPVVGEAAKDIAEILEGRRTDEVTVDDEGVQNREASRAIVGACKQEVSSTDGGAALLALDVRVGQRDPGIIEKQDQGGPLIDGIADRLAQRALGCGAAGEIADDPMDAVDERTAVAMPAAPEFVEVYALRTRVGLDRVDVAQYRHDHCGARVAGFEGLDEAAAAMVHAARAAWPVGPRKEGREPGIPVGLNHLSAEVGQDGLRPGALPVWRVLAEADLAAVAEEGPDVAALDPADMATITHRQARVVDADRVAVASVPPCSHLARSCQP